MTSSARGTGVAIILLCAGIVLAMNTATADGSRALYGISQDGMTIRWLGKLNRYHVPANAMTLDALLNILLLLTYASDPIGALKILVFSNLGYVLCHVFATSGFMLLRKRPAELAAADQGQLDLGRHLWPAVPVRPDPADRRRGQRRPRVWGQHALDARTRRFAILVIALGLYVCRVVVQEKKSLQLRLPAATMPEEEAAIGAPTSTV